MESLLKTMYTQIMKKPKRFTAKFHNLDGTKVLLGGFRVMVPFLVHSELRQRICQRIIIFCLWDNPTECPIDAHQDCVTTQTKCSVDRKEIREAISSGLVLQLTDNTVKPHHISNSVVLQKYLFHVKRFYKLLGFFMR